MSVLPPLPVAIPLAIAALLLVFSRLMPARMPDIVALLAALGCGAVCALMVGGAAAHPLVYWFGGWTPRPGVTLGIAFSVDQAGAVIGAFASLLMAASFVFAWTYFDAVHAHFHVLMLLFLAAMIGFALTHDLFDMFVWFEVMSVAAFALTGYRQEAAALDGALNFTVTNSLGSFLMLGGIALIYARGGALDFTALSHNIHPGDTVAEAAFCMLATAFLIKGAMVPFQFWLADAHAVAPSPVCVIFSGIMVSIAIFGIGRLIWAVFPGSPDVAAVVRHLLLAMGAASTVIGGAMCLMQRHLKRLLAFSTISHVGIMLIGLALLSAGGTAGMMIYLVGHGLVKAALFMVAGILLAKCGGIDEIGLRGAGRDIWPAGIVMAIGGLFLGGFPYGLMDEGARLIGVAGGGLRWVVLIGAACTGGAVLRACGRIFLGLGQTPGEEERAPTEQEQEKSNRPLWLMMLPCSLLLLLAFTPAHLATELALNAIPQFMHPGAPALHSLADKGDAIVPWLGMALAVLFAAYDLSRERLPDTPRSMLRRVIGPPAQGLQALHSGLIGDYVAWLTVGLAAFAVAFLVA